MLLLATAKPTVLEKLQAVPTATWISLLVAIVVIIALVRLWKVLREFNEFAPWIALVMVGGSVILYWTYERTEPKVLSPIFDVLSQYLPSKIQYKDAPTVR
jgi:chromate transport protein ChrA